jgi:hypothetical protein
LLFFYLLLDPALGKSLARGFLKRFFFCDHGSVLVEGSGLASLKLVTLTNLSRLVLAVSTRGAGSPIRSGIRGKIMVYEGNGQFIRIYRNQKTSHQNGKVRQIDKSVNDSPAPVSAAEAKTNSATL